MKKSIVLTLFLCFAGASVNAQTCKYVKNEVDKFTNAQIKQTKWERVISSFNTVGQFSIFKTDTSYFLMFDYTFTKWANSNPPLVNKGQSLQILLEDGNTVSVKSDTDVKGSYRNGAATSTYNLGSVSYPISLNELKTLGKAKAKTIRFYCIEGNGKETAIDSEISKKNSDDIKEMVKCML